MNLNPRKSVATAAVLAMGMVGFGASAANAAEVALPLATQLTITDNTGTATDTVVSPASPDAAGLTWGTPAQDAADPTKWTVSVTPAVGDNFPGLAVDEAYVLNVTLSDRTTVTPGTPTVTDASGTVNDTVVTPTTPHVTYTVSAGTNVAPHGLQFELTAQATDGYTFDAAGMNGWTIDANDNTLATRTVVTDRRAEITPLNPVITDVEGRANDSVALPASTTDLNYELIGDATKSTGEWQMRVTVNDSTNNKLPVTLTGAPGTWTRVSDTVATYRVVLTNVVTGITAIAQKPVITDNLGFANDNVVAPADTPEIKYTLTYNKTTGAYTLKAVATTGYKFGPETTANGYTIDAAQTTATLTGTLSTTFEAATADKPVITDLPGFEQDKVVAPANTTLVKYALVYDQKSGKFTLTAKAAEGYQFGATTTANGYTVSNDKTTAIMNGNVDPSSVIVTPEKPVIVDKLGVKDDSVTAPADTDKIKYTLVYNRDSAEWTLTAIAAPGYQFSDGKTENIQSGKLSGLILAKPVMEPVIVDSDGFDNDKVTAPKDGNGVYYLLDYDRASGEWTMTMMAAEGYVFENGETEMRVAGALNVDGGEDDSVDESTITDNGGGTVYGDDNTVTGVGTSSGTNAGTDNNVAGTDSGTNYGESSNNTTNGNTINSGELEGGNGLLAGGGFGLLALAGFLGRKLGRKE